MSYFAANACVIVAAKSVYLFEWEGEILSERVRNWHSWIAQSYEFCPVILYSVLTSEHLELNCTYFCSTVILVFYWNISELSWTPQSIDERKEENPSARQKQEYILFSSLKLVERVPVF